MYQDDELNVTSILKNKNESLIDQEPVEKRSVQTMTFKKDYDIDGAIAGVGNGEVAETVFYGGHGREYNLPNRNAQVS